jgi:hypothetical protein
MYRKEEREKERWEGIWRDYIYPGAKPFGEQKRVRKRTRDAVLLRHEVSARIQGS